MPPQLSVNKMEGSNQTVSHAPQLTAQGYNHQMQTGMWPGNKACQNTVGQNTNMENYSQQMNQRYYQGHYPSQNATDMNRYMPSVAKSSTSSAPSSYNPQYNIVRQNNYNAVNPNYHQASMKTNCASNAYYGNMNPPNTFTTNNVIQSPKKYANANHGLPQAPTGVPQNSQAPGANMLQASHFNEQGGYNMQNVYVNNYNMHAGDSQHNQQTYVARQQLSSPSTVLPNSDASPVTLGSSNQVSQVSSIPTPPETSSLPSDGAQTADGMSMDSSTDIIKIGMSSSSFALPGSNVNHMSTSMSTMNNNISMNNRTANNSLQPPANLDEGSQASSASASSSIPDDQNSAKNNSKPNFSYPPTPNTLSSPGAASMSSFHDDMECISSPGWPKTPASPVANNNYEFANIKRPENLLKLYTLSDEPDRRYFLDKLIIFNEDRGSPITQCPTISKQPLDVFRVYVTVKERGGFVEVTNAKRWKDIAGAIGVGASSSAAYTLRKQYMKLLLPFECKFDRGGIDPQPIINMVEASSRKKGKNAPNGPYGHPNQCNQGYPQAMDNYPSSNYPGSYPAARYHCNNNAVDYQCSSGNMPYSQSMQHSSPSHGQSQYNQYSHNSQADYGYYQGSSSSPAPICNSNMQTNGNSTMCRYSNNAASSSVPPEQSYYSHQYSNQQAAHVPHENSYNSRCMPQYNDVGQSQVANKVPEESEQAGVCGTYQATSSAASSQEEPAPETQQEKSFTDIDAHSSVSNSASDSTRDANPCYSNSYVASKTDNVDFGVSKSCPPTPCPPQPYQPPAIESKAPDPNYFSSPVPHQAPANSYAQNQYPNMKPGYQGGYQHFKDPAQISQHGHYAGSQNETYRGTEAPPVIQADPTRIPVSEIPNSAPKPYQYNCSPHKPNSYSYSPASMANKEAYNSHAHRDQFNNHPPRAWMGEQHPYSYQQSIGQRSQLNCQVNNADVKQGTDSPKMPKTWLGPREASHAPARQPNSSTMSMQNQNVHPNKQTHPSSMPGTAQPMMKRSHEFPPSSVEAVRPVAVKRRRCPAKRVGPVEAWRIMLALKSGLLGESTWALDLLSIFLCDSSSVVYFGLSHLPGLLGVLVEHYRCFLNKIFHLAEDLEISTSASLKKECKPTKQESVETEAKVPNGICKTRTSNNLNWLEKTKILDDCNYTYKTRCKKKVQIKYDEALFLIDPHMSWDDHEGFDVPLDHWQKGGGDITTHIQTAFATTSKKIKFARHLEDERKTSSEDVKSLSDSNDLKSSLFFNKGEPIVLLKKCDLLDKVHTLANKECKVEPDSEATEREDKTVESDSSLEKEGLHSCDSIKSEVNATVDKPQENSSDGQSEEQWTNSVDVKKEIVEDVEQKVALTIENMLTDAEEKKSQEASCEHDARDHELDECSPRLRGSLSSRKRFLCEELEDEAYCFDQPALCVTDEAQEMLSRRCACISTLLRNLSFVPGNDLEMRKSTGFLLLLGRILLLHHEHKAAKPAYRKYEKEADGNLNWDESCISLQDEHEWWWSTLNVLRDNTLVTLSNISGQLDLSPFPEEVSLPILDGLLHWVVCPSSYAQDPLPSQPTSSVLSPQRLSLEALCKLSILASNVDLIIATPPWSRIESLFAFLTKSLSRGQDQIMREFAIILLSNISQADTIAARTIAEQSRCISYLIGFIEEAEGNAFQIASSQGTKKLRDKPELMGTTPGMVQRAANTLKNLALVPENQGLFMRYQQRLLSLVTSQVMDQELAEIIADVLFYCSDEVTEDVSCQLPVS